MVKKSANRALFLCYNMKRGYDYPYIRNSGIFFMEDNHEYKKSNKVLPIRHPVDIPIIGFIF